MGNTDEFQNESQIYQKARDILLVRRNQSGISERIIKMIIFGILHFAKNKKETSADLSARLVID